MNTSRLARASIALAAVCSLPACVTLDVDISAVPIPVSAKPLERTAAEVKPFRLELKNVLWLHGLFGRNQPDIGAAVADASAGYDRIVDFRVAQGASFHDWLLAHLSVTLVRMKSVAVEGKLVRDG